MEKLLVDSHGVVEDAPHADAIIRRCESGEFFWLDIADPGPEDVRLLGETFGFHPLAVEDATKFGQRPKLDDYDDHIVLVVYGASDDDDGLVEVHCFYSERYLVTVRRDDCPAFKGLRRRWMEGGIPLGGPARALHGVVDVLVDSFFPELARIEDLLEDVEGSVLAGPAESQLQSILELRRRLVRLRRTVTSERDLIGTVVSGVASIPGMTLDGQRYYRDVHDHLIRAGETVDGQRDLATGVLEVYLSAVSNRLNDVTKQLALVATIFLPLTFLTGIFGQNFGWLVDHIGSMGAFIGFGVVLPLVALSCIVYLFKRRSWL
jgi:magnesium transporter